VAGELAHLLGQELGDELSQALERIQHCLGQLSEDQVWWRPTEAMNSVGNLLLHLAGNVRQWIVAGVGGATDNRNRPAEFSERGPIPKADLLRKLGAVIAEAKKAMIGRAPEDWMRIRRIQAHDVTGFAAALHSVAHFRGHTLEIIHMTRAQLGDRYRFAWVPATPEQGA
jgi:hypothetical protein